MSGTAGIDAASSAQSKRSGAGVDGGNTGLREGVVGDGGCRAAGAGGSDALAAVKGAGSGETARLWLSWGRLGCIGSDEEVGDERGDSLGADSVVGDTGGVYHTDDAETARLRGVWGVLGGWNALWGCSGGSRCVFRCSGGAVRGSEWGRAAG